ncbi:MAG: membrane metalloprotease [Crocinitomicaceae bacterium]
MKRIVQIAFLFLVFIFSTCQKDEPLIQIDEKPSDFLSAEKYDKLIIEVKYIDGYKPNEAAIDNALAFLNARLNKPEGISFIYGSLPVNANNTYSADDIRSIEDEHRTQFTKDNTVTMFIFYADKEFNQNTDNNKTLGIAYGPSSMAIFKSTVDDYSGGLGQPSTEKLETVILKHEFGHLLGLVNNGTPMTQDHEDPNHAGHCDNEDCLMYYTAETNNVLNNIGGGGTIELDNQCIDDLKANGGK